MKSVWTVSMAAAAAALLGGSALAAGNLAFQDAINVTVELGGSCNPASLSFEPASSTT